MLVEERVEIDRRLTQDGVGLELVVVEDAEVKLAVRRHQAVTEITTCPNQIKFIYTPHLSQTDSGVFTIKTINVKIKFRQITIIYIDH